MYKLQSKNEHHHMVSFIVDKRVTIGETINHIKNKNNIQDISIENENLRCILLNHYNTQDI